MTRLWRMLPLIVIAAVAPEAALLAHHSFATLYIEADTIEVEGDVVEFQYKNPHSWIFVQGHEGFGRDRIYAGEWTSTSQLERMGITEDLLPRRG